MRKLYFDLSRRYFTVFALALHYNALCLYYKLPSELGDQAVHFSGIIFIRYQLGYSVSVPQVYETQTAHFTDSLYPSGQCNFAADVRTAQFAASMCSIHIICN